MLDWTRIDTVLLDMDGTLLDLHFDTRFWLHHMPAAFGRPRGLDRDQAWAILEPRLKRAEGTLEWYCLDHWDRELELDLIALKRELAHLIDYRRGAQEFLERLRARGVPAVLVTNAHPRSLALKAGRTGLDRLLERTVSSHELGFPKESPLFWPALQALLGFEPGRTLFVDDSLPVLRAARAHGIAHLLAVRQPDSQGPTRDTAEFRGLAHFEDIMPP